MILSLLLFFLANVIMNVLGKKYATTIWSDVFVTGEFWYETPTYRKKKIVKRTVSLCAPDAKVVAI